MWKLETWRGVEFKPTRITVHVLSDIPDNSSEFALFILLTFLMLPNIVRRVGIEHRALFICVQPLLYHNVTLLSSDLVWGETKVMNWVEAGFGQGCYENNLWCVMKKAEM